MVVMFLEALLVGYLPGALLFRLPTAGRPGRATLPAEERAFLAVMLSVALSSMLALTLGAFEIYTFGRLLGALAGLCAVLILGSSFNLRLGPSAPRPGWFALIPVAIVAAGVWLYFPPAEWVIGGRDPGVYTNEGVRIAQTGSLTIRDPLVASLPPQIRDLVVPLADPPPYRRRFMGFLVEDAAAGSVVGQFPHLFPASMAVGYGIDGLTGVRRTAGIWGILGALAVYFAGTVVFGRAAAAAGAGLLSLHVAQVWFARSPYSELPLQALVFTALYAYARLEDGGSKFWGLVAACLLGAMMFLRVDAIIVFATVAAALLLDAALGRRIRWYFIALLSFWACAGLVYLNTFVHPYLLMPIGFVRYQTPLGGLLVALAGASAAAAMLWIRRRRPSPTAALPWAIVAAVLLTAGYAYFLREPGGFLAAHDAYALRSFTVNYFTPYLLAAALVGFALVVPRVFWTHTWFVLLVTVFCEFFFYKIRIVPEHFWIARRFLPVILPGMLLFAGAAFFAPMRLRAVGRPFRTGVSGGADQPPPRLRRSAEALAEAEAPPYVPSSSVGDVPSSSVGDVGRPFRAGDSGAWLSRARFATGVVVIAFAAWQFWQVTRPVLAHVEYADIIPRLEALAAQIHDDDIVLVESRGGSDIHVLALPLAYIYAKNVLVLATDDPVPADAMALYDWASQHYARVIYMGSGGSRLLNRSLDAEFVRSESIWVPEYDRSWDHVPTASRRKSFVFSLFRLLPLKDAPAESHVEVGAADELAVSRFHTPEQSSERKYRWTTAHSIVRLRLPATTPSKVAVWMGNGGRPSSAPAATVGVFAGHSFLGFVDVAADEIRSYEFVIPPEAVAEAKRNEGFLSVYLNVPTWNPGKVLGSPDTRNVGVMVTRVELR